jgi:hypothetical protein
LFGLVEKEVTDVTVNHLHFLGHQGLRISKTELQSVEEEVRYLGHMISKGNCRLGPLTKRELQKFLELIGYCRLWMESCALKTKTLYPKLLEEEPDPLVWEPEEILITET